MINKNIKCLGKIIKILKRPEFYCAFAIFIILTLLIHYYYSPESYSDFETTIPSLITSLAILISAICASVFARQNINQNRDRNRIQETIRFISSLEENKTYLEAKEAYATYQSNHKKEELLFLIINYHCENELEKIIYKELHKVQAYYNYFELISLSIEKKIIDEELYMEWHKTQLIKVWNNSVEAISALRCICKAPSLCIKWEGLVNKCAKLEKIEIKTLPKFEQSELEKTYCNEDIRKKYLHTLHKNEFPVTKLTINYNPQKTG